FHVTGVQTCALPIFFAPDMDEVLDAFEQLCHATFGPIFTWYPDDEDAVPCTWEPDGVGSSIGDTAARALRTALEAAEPDSELREIGRASWREEGEGW